MSPPEGGGVLVVRGWALWATVSEVEEEATADWRARLVPTERVRSRAAVEASRMRSMAGPVLRGSEGT
jgi:hypothetical protein